MGLRALTKVAQQLNLCVSVMKTSDSGCAAAKA